MVEHALRCLDRWDRIAVGARAHRLALAAGWSATAARELSIAASELASNVVRHGGGGTVRILVGVHSIALVAEDEGPGIADVAVALRDGHSRGRDLLPDDSRKDGLGTGLGAVVRAMDRVVVAARAPGGVEVRASRARG